MSPIRVRSKEPDQACAEAVGLARAALEDVVGGEQVGEHLGVEAGGDRLVTHLFECLDPAYPGWRWAVTVTRASRAKTGVSKKIQRCPPRFDFSNAASIPSSCN